MGSFEKAEAAGVILKSSVHIYCCLLVMHCCTQWPRKFSTAAKTKIPKKPEKVKLDKS